jgi:hypothetical protein
VSDNIIKVSVLKKHYIDGKIKALDGVDLEVKKVYADGSKPS